MRAFVVSDIHLGCAYAQAEAFMAFVRQLPEGAALILNGDTVHQPDTRHLPPVHQQALDLLRQESRRREIIWLRGNHDERYVMEDPEQIHFKAAHAIGRRIYLAHGYDFDNVMPHNRAFIFLFRGIHALRILLGAEAVHVAHYAKRFPFLYRILLNHVTMNAVQYARENGYEAVACGHTHETDDRIVSGIRYLNTGCWTEPDVGILDIDDTAITLRRVQARTFLETPAPA